MTDARTRLYSDVPNGHLVEYEGKQFAMLYDWRFPVEGGDWRPFGGKAMVDDLGPAEQPVNRWRRWRQAYRRRLLQVLITKHEYHLLGWWTEADLRHETKRYVSWFRERRFRNELAALVKEKLVIHASPFELSGQAPTYEVSSLGVVAAARMGLCKYPYI